jgi:hypothetical protein
MDIWTSTLSFAVKVQDRELAAGVIVKIRIFISKNVTRANVNYAIKIIINAQNVNKIMS